MSNSYTFNLGMIFHNGAAASIIVCHSDSPIDRQSVVNTATERLQIGLSTKINPREVLSFIVEGIKQECDLDVVLVNADAAYVIA